MTRNRKNKRGDASIVATVILIVSAIAIAVVVTTFSKESEQKVSEKIIKLGESVECEDIRLGIEDYDENTFTFTFMNRGTLGIDKFIARVYTSSGINPQHLDSNDEPKDFSDCNDTIFDPIQGENGVVNGRLLPQKKCNWRVDGSPDKAEIIPFIATKDGEIGCENKISTWKK
ncbi:hypothetical protein HYT56_01730 [Candidatus Woesearchaeota archaeon]|nr:hypothetical protein [Candidatus Woesearchaeota archaeon]